MFEVLKCWFNSCNVYCYLWHVWSMWACWYEWGCFSMKNVGQAKCCMRDCMASINKTTGGYTLWSKSGDHLLGQCHPRNTSNLSSCSNVGCVNIFICFITWYSVLTIVHFYISCSTNRLCIKTTTLSDGSTIPKGTQVFLPFSALHHDPKYWKDPEKFDPDRWV